MPGTVTVKDIARRARVSIGTVDRVLHKRGRAAERTVKKVMRAVSDLGYTPNVFARHLSRAKKHAFGVVMPQAQQNGGYWKLADAGLVRSSRELSSYNITIDTFSYDRYSKTSFEKAILRAAKECPDGLLCAVVDPAAGLSALKNVLSSVPVVLFDSFIPGVEAAAFIGQESYQSGLLSGKLMAMCVRDGAVIVVEALAGDFHITERIRGFKDHFASSSRHTLVMCDMPGDAADDAAVADVFSRNPDAAGIFVSSADIHRFATYLEKHGGKNGRALIGYDLTDINRRHVESGMIDFLIDQRPDVQVYEGLSILYRTVVLGEEPQRKKILMPLDVITRENVQYYR